MSRPRTYTDSELTAAVAASRSWRGVLRALGLVATSSSAMGSVRRRADALGLDHTHFTGQRRWTEVQLSTAVAASRSWGEVAEALGLAESSSRATLRGHAVRLGLDTTHLEPAPPPRPSLTMAPAPANLRRAGALAAATWFTLCGHDVSWPLEPSRYDLLVDLDGSLRRVQVKTTTVRSGSSYTVWLSTTSRGRTPYDVDEIDYFLVIDADLGLFLIPAVAVGGLHAIQLSAYEQYRVKAPGAMWS